MRPIRRWIAGRLLRLPAQATDALVKRFGQPVLKARPAVDELAPIEAAFAAERGRDRQAVEERDILVVAAVLDPQLRLGRTR